MTSPISVEQVLTSDDSCFQVLSGGEAIHWLAAIAAEDFRVTIKRWQPEQEIVDLTPRASVRSRVMEYGGGAYDVATSVIAYCDDYTDRLWLLEEEQHRPLTAPSKRFYYGGLHLLEKERLLLAVREDHEASPEARTEIVQLSLDSENPEGGKVLVTGADFYAGLCVHDGTLAWYQWQHPNMPWDAAQVWTAPLADLSQARQVSPTGEVSSQHPSWTPAGELMFTSDESGYWNWHLVTAEKTYVRQVERDCDVPTWVLNRSPQCADIPGLVAMTEYHGGAGALALWRPASGEVTHPLPGTSDIESIAALDETLFVIARWPDRPASLVRLAPDGTCKEIVASAPLPGAVIPESRWAEGPAGPVQSWYYPTANRDSAPLLVLTHGGPTAMHTSTYQKEVQFWIQRGFSVLDVNYSGSTGFGRAYRDRLKGSWGLLEVSDVEASVTDLVSAGLADPAKVAIAGGSAGGYTTLQALVTSKIFAAGMSSYGIGDLTALACDTHKFESRYLDSLVVPWPAGEQIYRDRSPINQLSSLRTPMLILQGLEDKVVPPEQAFQMADAVRAKGLPLALLTFEGEQHGFRSVAARRASLEAKLSFLEQVLGLPHSQDIPKLTIENLS